MKPATQSWLDFADQDQLLLVNSLYTDSRYPPDIGQLPGGAPTEKDARLILDFTMECNTRVRQLFDSSNE